MLSVQEIAERIVQPNRVTKEDLLPLKDLSTKYPYTQLFSILYLKGLSISGDIQFEDELNKNAYRICDRVHLFELIKSNEPVIHKQPVNLSTSIESPAIKVETRILEISEEKIIELGVESISESTTEGVELNAKELTEEPKSELIEVPVKIQPGFIEPEKSEHASDVIVTISDHTEMPVQKHLQDDNILEDEIVEELEEKSLKTDALDKEILNYALTSNYELGQLSDEENELLEKRLSARIGGETDTTPEENEVNEEERKSFISWITSNKNYSDTVNQDMEAINAVVKDFADFDPSERLFGEMDKPRREFFSPIKKAKESLREDGLPVSETLAKIYVAQGNYVKAIDAYTQLSLKYPEKKIFFANLIEDLTKKLNTE